MTDADFNCRRCGKSCLHNHDYYMVTDEVWLDEAGLSGDDFICRGCLASALGRELVLSDYTSAPINRPILAGEFGLTAQQMDALPVYWHRRVRRRKPAVL